MDELVYGVFRPESVTDHQLVIRRMKDEGCDAVVLGCTEIPLIISNKNSPLPVLDSTRLLAWVALKHAVAELRTGIRASAYGSGLIGRDWFLRNAPGEAPLLSA